MKNRPEKCPTCKCPHLLRNMQDNARWCPRCGRFFYRSGEEWTTFQSTIALDAQENSVSDWEHYVYQEDETNDENEA